MSSDAQPASERAATAHGVASRPEVLALRPSPLFVALFRAGPIAGIVVATLALRWAALNWGTVDPAPGALVGDGGRTGVEPVGWVVLAGVVLVGLLLVWSALDWWTRSYELTASRVVRVSGVLRRARVELALAQVQTVVMTRGVRERAFGLGSLTFTSGAGGSSAVGTALSWTMIGAPGRTLDVVREAIDRARSAPVRVVAVAPERGNDPGMGARPIMVGLAGGVGSGKSRAARALASMGCVVSDSDAEASAVLAQPRVRERLVEWWGREVLDSEGQVDRRRVAAIVFADPEQRRRLEALTHPLIKAARDATLERARQQGVRVVVIDAPLLFEAGLEAECEAVVFVDAPREDRLRRVRESRGWDEAELDRRERAQLPLEEKRRRSRFVVANGEGAPGLEGQLRAVLDELLGELHGERGGARPG